MSAADPNPLPRMLVVGSSAHLGPQLVDAVRGHNRAIVFADCSPARCGAPVHPNIAWLELDIANRDAFAGALREVREAGGVDVVVHLAADRLPGEEARREYRRVNVDGLRNVLEGCRELESARFIFARSAAAAREDTGQPARSDDKEERRDYDDADREIEALLASAPGTAPVSRIQIAARPRILVTGASGFIGRHLLDTLKDDYQIFGLARGSQAACGAPVDPNITWFQLDIHDREALDAVCGQIAQGGGVDIVLHLAAYYDFVSKEHPEYWRTNVEGLRNVLEASKLLTPDRFVFASSIAASSFPPAGSVLTESSPPDGWHVYATTKRIGEAMLAEYRDHFPSVIVRFTATFSDWCEYPPVFVSMERWRAAVWHRRVLGGRGRFAVPYLHVREVQTFTRRLLAVIRELDDGEVLLASSDDPVAMRELFEATTRHLEGEPDRPLVLPRAVCRAAMHVRDWGGRALGERPFERPWMARYIDRQLPVDASRTRQRLGWSPRERLGLLRRLPFLVENLKNDPSEWHRRNNAAMNKTRTTFHLRLHWLLERHEKAILRRMLAALGTAVHASAAPGDSPWSHRLALHQLMNAIRTRDMSVYASYCRDLADRRFSEGALPGEVGDVLRALRDACVEVLRGTEESARILRAAEDQLAMTTLFGCDQIEERFEELHGPRGSIA